MTLKCFFRKPLVALAALFMLAACSGGDGSRVEQGIQDGVFHLGNGTEPQAIDPHITSGVPEHRIIQSIFEGLVTKNPYSLEIEAGVAQSWEISEDGRLYTFHINEEARWSNGDPITAEDFRWSWQRALDPALGNQYNYMYFPIVNAEEFATGRIADFDEVGVTVIDEHTLEVALRAPTSYFLQTLDHQSMFPVHRATLEAHGSPSDRLSQWARPGNIVSNGAFELTEWRINSHLRVEKSENYWDADNVSLNAIVFYPTENIMTEERMFRDGQLHMTNEVPLDKIPEYQAQQPELIQVAPYLGTYYYLINTEKAPFDDVRVRQALAMAVDRELLVETVLNGLVEPAYAIVPPDTLGYYPPQTFEYDADRARELLAEAGYPDGEGFPSFDILYNTHEEHQKIAVAIQQMWRRELGIGASILNQEWKVYLDTQENMDYDISRRGWIGDYVDPYTFLDMFITNGGNNMTGYADPRYDELILQQAPRELDQERRYEMYLEAETMLMESMPIIPLYTYQSKHLKHPSLQGIPPNILNYFNFKYVTLESEE